MLEFKLRYREEQFSLALRAFIQTANSTTAVKENQECARIFTIQRDDLRGAFTYWNWNSYQDLNKLPRGNPFLLAVVLNDLEEWARMEALKQLKNKSKGRRNIFEATPTHV